EVLRAHLARVDRTGQLQEPVGERRFAVVDVGDDRQAANVVEGRHVKAILAFWRRSAEPAPRAVRKTMRAARLSPSRRAAARCGPPASGGGPQPTSAGPPGSSRRVEFAPPDARHGPWGRRGPLRPARKALLPSSGPLTGSTRQTWRTSRVRRSATGRT